MTPSRPTGSCGLVCWVGAGRGQRLRPWACRMAPPGATAGRDGLAAALPGPLPGCTRTHVLLAAALPGCGEVGGVLGAVLLAAAAGCEHRASPRTGQYGPPLAAPRRPAGRPGRRDARCRPGHRHARRPRSRRARRGPPATTGPRWPTSRSTSPTTTCPRRRPPAGHLGTSAAPTVRRAGAQPGGWCRRWPVSVGVGLRSCPAPPPRVLPSTGSVSSLRVYGVVSRGA